MIASLLECALVNYVEKGRNVESPSEKQLLSMIYNVLAEKQNVREDVTVTAGDNKVNSHQKESEARIKPQFITGQKIHLISRVLFPILFAMFNIIYWSYFL